MVSKAKAKLAEAKAKYKEAEAAVEGMKNAISMLKAIEDITNQYYRLTLKLDEALEFELDKLDEKINIFCKYKKRRFWVRIKVFIMKLFGKPTNLIYDELGYEIKSVLHSATHLIGTTKIVLDMPLLNIDGSMNNQSLEYIEETDFNCMIEGGKYG